MTRSRSSASAMPAARSTTRSTSAAARRSAADGSRSAGQELTATRVDARRHRIAEQEAAAAADVEQLLAGSEIEGLEDRAAGPVVDVLRAVDRTGPVAARPPGDTVGEPVLEPPRREAAGRPCRDVLVAEAERSHR